MEGNEHHPSNAKRMNRPESEDVQGADRFVSTAHVAKALGVSVTTVKRWVDDGVLPAARTPGGHRKLRLNDVLRVTREGNFPLADLTALVPPAEVATVDDPKELAKDVIKAADSGDTELIRGLLISAYRNGMPIETLADRVLCQVMRHIGHAWETDRADVMHEHRITQACVSALYEIRSILRADLNQGRPVAVGGAPEHDHYAMASLLAKLTLLDNGWDAINLGPHTPVSALWRALDELRPRLIWLSVTHLVDPEKFLADYNPFCQEAMKRGVAVVVGGQGLREELRTRLVYTAFGDGLTQLASLARTLYRKPLVPKRGRPPGRASDAESGK